MGRAARRKAATRVILPRADYFELRALLRDIEAVELDALKAAAAFKVKMQEARAKTAHKLAALAKAHGFNDQGTWGWDDATCALIRKDT
jgi:hypothetical protein